MGIGCWPLPASAEPSQSRNTSFHPRQHRRRQVLVAQAGAESGELLGVVGHDQRSLVVVLRHTAYSGLLSSIRFRSGSRRYSEVIGPPAVQLHRALEDFHGLLAQLLGHRLESGVATMKQRSADPGVGRSAFGSNSPPAWCRLIFCAPKARALRPAPGNGAHAQHAGVEIDAGVDVADGEHQVVETVDLHGRLPLQNEARQFEQVLGHVGQDQVGGDRRHLVQAGLAELALDVVLAGEAEAAVGLQAGVGRPRKLSPPGTWPCSRWPRR